MKLPREPRNELRAAQCNDCAAPLAIVHISDSVQALPAPSTVPITQRHHRCVPSGKPASCPQPVGGAAPVFPCPSIPGTSRICSKHYKNGQRWGAAAMSACGFLAATVVGPTLATQVAS